MLPIVDFCGLKVTRLIIGANPFSGFSHQNAQRDSEMKTYYTVDRIIETWKRAEAAGINTFITNNETEHVQQAVRQYLSSGGAMQWIAQLNCRKDASMSEAIDEAVAIGCKALFFHGGLVDKAYTEKDEASIRAWFKHARKAGVPAGTAGHAPVAHRWVDSLDIADFHMVCFFNCGSLHGGKGDEFRLEDIGAAVKVIRSIRKPCIAYKILGAGRIDPLMGFEYAFKHIKPGDVVNVGMHRGDKDNMVEENAAIVQEILGKPSR